MVNLWMPGAEVLRPSSPGGTPLGSGPPRAVWHTTESGTGDETFVAVRDWLVSQSTEPTLLWDPTTGRVGQFFPADRSGRALRNDGSDRTNRTGKITVQIEVLGRAKDAPLKRGPMKNLDKILAWMDDLGIERAWPAGYPPAPSDKTYGTNNGLRSRTIWRGKGGYYGHVHVPNNTHNDPGEVDPAKFKKVEVHQVTDFPKPGSRKMIKTPVGTDVLVKSDGKTPVTLATINLPAGADYEISAQLRVPRGLPALAGTPAGAGIVGEMCLGRRGWGTADKTDLDETGHNPVFTPSTEERWRTPVTHNIVGGGPLELRLLLPQGNHRIRFVFKAVRVH